MMNRKIQKFLAVTYFSVMSSAVVASDIFLVIPNIPGETNDATFGESGGIDVLQSSGNFARNACEFSITKFVDLSSAPLMLAALTGERLDTATIFYSKGEGSQRINYLTFILTNSVVSAISNDGNSSDDRATELVSFLPDSVEITYVQQNPDGSGGTPEVQTVSCSSNSEDAGVDENCEDTGVLGDGWGWNGVESCRL